MSAATLSPRAAEAVAEFVAKLIEAEKTGHHGTMSLIVGYVDGHVVRLGNTDERTFPKTSKAGS